MGDCGGSATVDKNGDERYIAKKDMSEVGARASVGASRSSFVLHDSANGFGRRMGNVHNKNSHNEPVHAV